MIVLKTALATAAPFAVTPIALAQAVKEEPIEPEQDIIVTAQRSGAPMWVVEQDGARVILVNQSTRVRTWRKSPLRS